MCINILFLFYFWVVFHDIFAPQFNHLPIAGHFGCFCVFFSWLLQIKLQWAITLGIYVDIYFHFSGTNAQEWPSLVYNYLKYFLYTLRNTSDSTIKLKFENSWERIFVFLIVVSSWCSKFSVYLQNYFLSV